MTVSGWTKQRRRARAITVLLAAALVALGAIPIVALWHAFRPKPVFAPDFSLVDQDGQPFTLSAQRGHPVALFFGYTHCPDACPTTLAHLARAVRSADVPRDIRVAFITVDPQRDSPAVLKRYVRLFDPDFIGITGTLRTLDPVYAAYHTWHEASPANHGPNDYSVAHGTTIYYVGRDGTLKGLGSWDDGTSQITRAFKEYQ